MRVALTFDAEYPGRLYPGDALERILDVLCGESLRSTFFIQGKWVAAHPDLGRAIADRGHLIGSHSYHHANSSWLSDEGIEQDLNWARIEIQTHTGFDPFPLFRLPYGDGDARVRRRIAKLGWRHVGWNVDNRDWHPDTDLDDFVAATVAECEQRDVSVVLMHSWPKVTPLALPQIVDRLRGRGAEFVTVADLDDDLVT